MAIIWVVLAFFGGRIFVVALSQQESTAENLVTIVATTNIVGNIVSQIGGSNISLYVMIPPGADPHQYQLTPRDIRNLFEADIIFMSGSGLEDHFIGNLMSDMSHHRVVRLSENVTALSRDELELGETKKKVSDGGTLGARIRRLLDDSYEELDPHVWMDPIVVAAWAIVIANSLSGLDPINEESYTRNAITLEDELYRLDDWVKQRVATIPLNQRVLVTDHLSFGYFANRYDFRLQESVVGGSTTVSQLSARHLSELRDAIIANQIPAIFVGTTVNFQIADTIARELGIKMVVLYTDSLSDSDGPASSYQEYVVTNVNRIVEALTEN